jgi:DNA-binding MarR family transcriptional regulator
MNDETIAVKVLTTFPLFTHKMFHDFLPDTGKYNLNKTQVKALLVVHVEDSPHMSQVCHHMNMEKGSLTPVIDSLIALNLVERSRNRDDRRKVNIALTDEGRELVHSNLERAHEHILGKIDHLPAEDVERFKQALLDLHDIASKI